MKNNDLKEDKTELNNNLKKIFNDTINSPLKEYKSIYEYLKENKNISEYQMIIKNNITNSNAITFILHSLSKKIFHTELFQDKMKLFHLLLEFYLPFLNDTTINNISLTYPYLSCILTVIQNNLSINISPKFISNIFSIIMEIIMKDNDRKMKKYYEISQGFCFYNMKQNEYENQICGVLCLKELINNTNYFVGNKKCIKNISEKILLFLDNNNFEPKIYLIDILFIFINKSQKEFKPYVNVTFYKLLNYFEFNDITLKQKILDVFDIILHLFPYEFIHINESLMNFFNILSKDRNDYIKKKSNQILERIKIRININTFNSNISSNDKSFSTLTTFRKNNTPLFNNIFRNSYCSKSIRCISSRKYPNQLHIKELINKDKKMNKNYNINYKRKENKIKKNYSNNKENNCLNTIDNNKISLLLGLKNLKKDVNEMSSSFKNHVNHIENKIYCTNKNNYLI